MATKSKKSKPAKKRSKSKVAKKKDYTLYYVGAGILGLIAIPVISTLITRSNLPGEAFSSQGNAHVSLEADVPEYNSNPPTSGPHTDNLTSWGSYDYVVPERTLIHNLEDGGVVMYYPLGSPEENNAEIERLEAALEAAEAKTGQSYRHVVIAPRENLTSPYVLTAWTRKLELDSLDQEQVTKFIDAFEGIDHHVPGIG